MIDLHTHILCAMDDGAADVQTSLRLLEAQRAQGVDTVVLTPHFHRGREDAEHFLCRRETQLQLLLEQHTEQLPRLICGAEVAWVPNLHQCEQLDRLCIGSTRNLLLELPRGPWPGDLAEQLWSLMSRTGITPVLAHLERYVKTQKPEHFREILSLEVPVQITASALLEPFRRGSALRLLRNHGHVLASDCHDLTRRPPNLAAAMETAAKKLGAETAARLQQNAMTLCGTEGIDH